MKPFLLIALVFLFACENSRQEEKALKIDASNISFASENDPVCLMPVKDYLTDTAAYKGEVYGFCNLACKKEFVKNPEKYVGKE